MSTQLVDSRRPSERSLEARRNGELVQLGHLEQRDVAGADASSAGLARPARERRSCAHEVDRPGRYRERDLRAPAPSPASSRYGSAASARRAGSSPPAIEQRAKPPHTRGDRAACSPPAGVLERLALRTHSPKPTRRAGRPRTRRNAVVVQLRERRGTRTSGRQASSAVSRVRSNSSDRAQVHRPGRAPAELPRLLAPGRGQRPPQTPGSPLTKLQHAELGLSP